MQLSTIRQLVQAAGFPSTYSTPGGLIDTWINQAQHEILDRFPWACREASASFSTVNGQQTYVVAGTSPVIPDFAGSISWRANTVNGGTVFGKLIEMDQQQFDEIPISVSGPPVFFCLRGGTPSTTSGTVTSGGSQVLATFPMPDAVYTVQARYYRTAESVEMSASGDVPLLPVRLHLAIVQLATAIGYEFENAPDQAVPQRQAVDRRVQEAIGEEARKRRASDDAVGEVATPPYPPAQAQPQLQGRAA